jgi:hypothetical protein
MCDKSVWSCTTHPSSFGSDNGMVKHVLAMSEAGGKACKIFWYDAATKLHHGPLPSDAPLWCRIRRALGTVVPLSPCSRISHGPLSPTQPTEKREKCHLAEGGVGPAEERSPEDAVPEESAPRERKRGQPDGEFDLPLCFARAPVLPTPPIFLSSLCVR